MPSPIQFSGIYANFNSDNMKTYLNAFKANPAEHQLKPYATRIFRELDTINAITKLVGNNPADIHLLGASDGSEVYAHAMAFQKKYGQAATKNVRVIGVDYTPSLVNLAKTGYLVCTDQEKVWANDAKRCPNHPLAGSGWKQYLTQENTGPKGFEELVKKYPTLAQIEKDTVAGISIGNGMHWYKVNQEGLPKVEFQHGDMTEYVGKPSSKAAKQVYVLSNALAYTATTKGLPDFLSVFQNIKNNDSFSEKLIVLGDLEHQIFSQVPQVLDYLKMFGMEPLSEAELKQKGVKKADKVHGNIWRMAPGPQVKLSFKS